MITLLRAILFLFCPIAHSDLLKKAEAASIDTASTNAIFISDLLYYDLFNASAYFKHIDIRSEFDSFSRGFHYS